MASICYCDRDHACSLAQANRIHAAVTSDRPKCAIMELRVGGKYRLGRKIGSGSFGDIYLGESREGEGPRQLNVGQSGTEGRGRK